MDPRTDAGRHRLSPWPHVIWDCVVIAVVALILVGAANTDHPENQCSGIGWGCTLSGGDLAAFVAFLIVPPALFVLTAGHLVIWVTQRWLTR